MLRVLDCPVKPGNDESNSRYSTVTSTEQIGFLPQA